MYCHPSREIEAKQGLCVREAITENRPSVRCGWLTLFLTSLLFPILGEPGPLGCPNETKPRLAQIPQQLARSSSSAPTQALAQFCALMRKLRGPSSRTEMLILPFPNVFDNKARGKQVPQVALLCIVITELAVHRRGSIQGAGGTCSPPSIGSPALASVV